ncbi:hypothetical protein BIW11_07830 [Tropilaelaps mercedesae]|uniref:Uncharacterized protein n=1 Tax=Tropilaelaps mercedesae TaxID=418985 RepID=A0A1V9XS79_9ACAR|nr:hypothetical protein BIW11_07830 [Tropilaelaps mercedesae]
MKMEIRNLFLIGLLCYFASQVCSAENIQTAPKSDPSYLPSVQHTLFGPVATQPDYSLFRPTLVPVRSSSYSWTRILKTFIFSAILGNTLQTILCFAPRPIADFFC